MGNVGTFRGVLAVIAALLFALLAAAPAGAAPAWLSPEAVSSREGEAFSPKVAVDAAGDSTAVWYRDDGTREAVEVNTRPAGGRWAIAGPLSDTARIADDPEVAVDPAGDAVVVWEEVVGGHFLIEARVRPAGGSWGAAEQLSSEGQSAIEPVVAIDAAGEAVAAWTRSDGSKDIVEASTRPKGGTWSAPEKLSAAGEDAREVGAGIGAGEATVVWRRANGTNQVIEASSRPRGGGWSGAAELSDDSHEADNPEVAVAPDGEAVVLWRWDNGLHEVIQATVRAPGGGPWPLAEELSAFGSDAFEPAVAATDGGVAAVWSEGGAVLALIEVATLAPGGGWSPAKAISEGGGEANGAQVSLDAGGRAFVAWQRGVGPADAVVEAAQGTVGGSWSGPSKLSASEGVDGRTPDVGVDAGGDATVVWRALREPNLSIEAAGYEGAGPQLLDLTVPASGFVGESLVFGARAFDVWAPVTGVTWTFGDGRVDLDKARTVNHIYRAPGTYRVTARAGNSLLDEVLVERTVTISPAPSALPPAPSTKGRARAGRVLRVKHGRALLALGCPAGSAGCAGTAKLTVTVAGKAGKHRRRLIAKARFAVAAGARKTVRMPLKKLALTLLGSAGKHGLGARLSGAGVASRPVVLKPGSARRGKPRAR
jgi:hypothetical protein